MSFNDHLQQEIGKWLAEGLISPATAEDLRQRYPVQKRSMTQTLALLGSILLGIGVILFFAANWDVMPRILKITVVVLSFSLSYLVGYYLRHHKKTYPKVGYALICLGSILYGAAIWLIAQIFHLEAEAGMGYLLWYLGVIPVAYLFDSSFNLALALINLVAWFLAGQHPLGWAYLVFPFFLAVTILPLALKKKDAFNFTISVVAAYIWFIPLGVKLANLRYSFQIGIISLLLFSIILYYVIVFFGQKELFAGDFLLGLSLLGLFTGFAPFTFHSFLEELAVEHTPVHGFSYLILASLLVIALIKIKEKKIGWSDTPLLLSSLCLFLYFPSWGNSLSLLILLNIAFFVLVLLSVYYGYLLKRPFIFNLTIVMFAAAVVMKYFDIFFALMPRSVFFMSGGILLLLGSLLLEHKRRDLLKSMERGEENHVES